MIGLKMKFTKFAALVLVTSAIGAIIFGCVRAPINTNIDTSNWKVYRNDENGLEFRYPTEWTPYITSTNPLAIKFSDTPQDVWCSSGTETDRTLTTGMAFSIKIEKSTTTLDEILQSCTSQSEIVGECDFEKKNLGKNILLIINDWYSLCSYPAAFLVNEGKLYTFESKWWPRADHETKNTKLFMKFLDTIKLD